MSPVEGSSFSPSTPTPTPTPAESLGPLTHKKDRDRDSWGRGRGGGVLVVILQSWMCGFLNFLVRFWVRVEVRVTVKDILTSCILEWKLRCRQPQLFIPSSQSSWLFLVPSAFGPGPPTALSPRQSDCRTLEHIHYPCCHYLGFKWQKLKCRCENLFWPIRPHLTFPTAEQYYLSVLF